MNEGKKFRVYPTKEQIKTLSQWIGHQRFIYNSKVGKTAISGSSKTNLYL